MLELNNVQKRYDNFQLDCSLHVPEGCITGLIGKNGAGKSTTFKAILDLINIDSGEIRVFGKERSAITLKDKERIGVVLADSGFSAYLSIQQISKIMRKAYHRFHEKEFLEQCRELELPSDKKLKDFSTGMTAKLKVLLAMSHDADFLILDEPTAGLDVIVRSQILDMLRDYMQKEGRSILISSHISSDLEGLCDDLYMIDQGKIVLHEETDVLLSQYGLLKIDEKRYASIDKEYLLRKKKESYGYCCLTDQKQFYLENYPGIVVEKGSIDEVITMMIKGDQV